MIILLIYLLGVYLAFEKGLGYLINIEIEYLDYLEPDYTTRLEFIKDIKWYNFLFLCSWIGLIVFIIMHISEYGLRNFFIFGKVSSYLKK